MRAVGAVAGRRAAVPAEVVQLVAHVRHRRLVHDPALLGVDHGEEVGRLDPGALVQAGEVEELLRRGQERLLRRAVEGGGLPVFRVHLSSFQVVAVVLTTARFFEEAAPRFVGANVDGGQSLDGRDVVPIARVGAAMRRSTWVAISSW